MINLLPPQQKSELMQEENWKQIILWSIFLSFFLMSLILIFISINNFLSGKVEAGRIMLEQKEREFNSPQTQKIKGNLANFNQTLFSLNNFYKSQPEFSDVLVEIAETVPQNITLNNLSLTPKGKDFYCNLTGLSPDRNSLLVFKNNLEKKENFREINFPYSNWVESQDINFTVSFKINESEE